MAPGGNVRISDIKDGKEKVDVCGKSVDATTHEETLLGTHHMWVDDGGPGGPTPVTLNQHWKTWRWKDVTGRECEILVGGQGAAKVDDNDDVGGCEDCEVRGFFSGRKFQNGLKGLDMRLRVRCLSIVACMAGVVGGGCASGAGG